MKILLTLLLSIVFIAAKAQTTYTVTKDTSVKLEGKTYFDTVDVQPHFKGNLGEYLVKNMRIPKGMTPKGKITAQFWIDTAGRISYVDILGKTPRAPVTALEKEVVRVIKGMPNWEPGYYKNKKVMVRYSLPIIF